MSSRTNRKNRRQSKKKNSGLSYDDFINLPKNNSYFFPPTPDECLELAPQIKEAIGSVLYEKPLEESELIFLLDIECPKLSTAFQYILWQTEYEEDFKCTQALKVISEGIEVRKNGSDTYFGLVSRLDSI